MVELLVVIAIIGILVALLLPALNSVRESARRSLCSSNAKQLALAVNAHYESRRKFPASGTFGDGEALGEKHKVDDIKAGGNGTPAAPYSWLVHMLPHCEFGHVYDTIDFSENAFSEANKDELATVVPLFRCPSYQGPSAVAAGSGYSRKPKPAIGNYKSLGATARDVLKDSDNMASSNGQGGAINPIGGVRRLSATTQTVLLCETKEEKYAVWADGTTTALYGFDRGERPLAFGTLISTDPKIYQQGPGHSPTKVALNNIHRKSLSAPNYANESWGPGQARMQWGPSSEHPGVTVHSFGDTNTRAISNGVGGLVYEALITRKTTDNGQVGDWFSQ